MLIFHHWILISGPDISVSIFENLDFGTFSGLYIVCIENITKPLQILYQIRKLLLNFAYLGNVIYNDPAATIPKIECSPPKCISFHKKWARPSLFFVWNTWNLKILADRIQQQTQKLQIWIFTIDCFVYLLFVWFLVFWTIGCKIPKYSGFVLSELVVG